ncbi:Uncharacterized protein TCM_043277 [Theobroma cacao]|uniref:Uncharacterized protein n=1 Tax=Theobroma cacao TaxID=3641 RepID=A0A061FQ35_THECC|nr:Uncharacterized protein TCM_043277 [Theobroma cacao]
MSMSIVFSSFCLTEAEAPLKKRKKRGTQKDGSDEVWVGRLHCGTASCPFIAVKKKKGLLFSFLADKTKSTVFSAFGFTFEHGFLFLSLFLWVVTGGVGFLPLLLFKVSKN